MKRILSFALAIAAGQAIAEQPAMEHVLVSVPLHKKTAETAMPVTVLSGDDLRRAAASTIGDTLSNTPGLANASFGPGVGQPVIRGQQGPRVTVLQNGTSSADASSLSADHAVGVEPMLADSIEILRGPATLLYGGGAIGGVVNIVDNRIPVSLEEEGSGGVEYRHDAASDMDTLVYRGEIDQGNFMFHLDGLLRRWNDLEIPGEAAREDGHGEDHEEETTDGYIANTDGDTTSLTFGTSYHFDSGFFGLAVNRLENEYGVPAGAHEHQEEHEEEEPEEEPEGEHGIRIDADQTRYDAALHWHEPIQSIEVFRGFLTYTDYEHSEIEGNGEVGTRYSNETWEARLELVHQPLLGVHGVFGLQVLDGEFSALGEEAFVPLTDSSEFGLFLLEDFHSGDWTLEGGLRFDRDERDPETTAARKQSFNSFSLSGSALWDVTPDWQLGLSLSRAERAPATEELFSNVEAVEPHDYVIHAATGAIEVGDQGLDSEVSRNLDVSLGWAAGDALVDLALFYNDFSDYINLVNTGLAVEDIDVLRYAQEDVEFYGVELTASFGLIERSNGQLMLEVFGDSIRGTLDSGADIPRLPPHRIGARIAWEADQWNAWGRVVEAGDQDRPGENEEPTDGYTRWDLGAEYRVMIGHAELLLFANLKNVSDEEIRLSTSFLRDVAPEAGRSIEGGIRFTF